LKFKEQEQEQEQNILFSILCFYFKKRRRFWCL